jgi:vacuolar-type H+-ATPase subunit B/Vma2|tara:strand:+ start:132 stop:455 length:324 start_codon:yes stop_codon:yes gene_type:complete
MSRKGKKRIVVEIDEHIHAEWMTKLYDDEITQTKLFRAVMEAYIKDDKTFRKFVDEHKEKFKIQSRAKRYRISKNIDKSKKLKEQLNITEDELDSIFDVIENHHTEL